jgi:hypothetical protein
MPHPFSFLPKPGQSMKFPGGVIWCESWEVTENSRDFRNLVTNEVEGRVFFGTCEGEIVFRFQCDAGAYAEAMAAPASLPGAPLALPG